MEGIKKAALESTVRKLLWESLLGASVEKKILLGFS